VNGEGEGGGKGMAVEEIHKIKNGFAGVCTVHCTMFILFYVQIRENDKSTTLNKSILHKVGTWKI
jgi:hypothetical protein